MIPSGLLFEWFEREGRDLPWRRTRDRWQILVSESMLQQTQVARVVERLPGFLARFPDPSTCAAAPVGDVIEEWAGLGFNRRAVNLHRTATTVVAEHDGVVPGRLPALLDLPGVGPYTARAVLAFADEADVAVVDTNVARVLARIEGRTLKGREVQTLADESVPAGSGWVWNQALVELGALICRPAPYCERCPVAMACRWNDEGRPEPDPAVGSAGVSGSQSRFEGSDRQGRGRLVTALRSGPVREDRLPSVMGWPDDPDRAERVAVSVVADGLAEHVDRSYQLPRPRK